MSIPLSEKMRPQKLEDVAGQPHLVGPDGWITTTIKMGKPLSILLYGPPGSGKTTLAKLYAQAFSARFITLSAVFSGIADLKKILKEKEDAPIFNQKVILFVDEIHRFNKAQQDAFLPLIEEGILTLVGATTENPSFALNNALLSRLRILILSPLTPDDLLSILMRYEKTHAPLPLSDTAKQHLIGFASGDARHLLNMIENIEGRTKKDTPLLEKQDLEKILQKKLPLYDKHDDGHYNLISALHKSVRGSDPDASLFWLARMLESGEDPLYIVRRMIRMASEDIGLADPQALNMVLQARETYHILGSPEGELAIAQALIYLALCPKSNAVYSAYSEACRFAKDHNHLPPPPHIVNAPTKLMKDMGFGKGYIYDHETENGFSGQNYFPEGMERESFYDPVERGFEREMKKRLSYFSSLRKNTKNPS